MSDDDDHAKRRGARRPAGPAGGVNDGRYPNPAFGMPVGGMHQLDDFVGTVNKVSMRTQLNWTVNDIGGGVSVDTLEDGATEIGILRMYTAGALNDGGTLYLPNSRLVTGPPVGLKWGVKVRSGTTNPGTTTVGAWAGYASSTNTHPIVADAMSLIGIRVQAFGSTEHWFGVCKNGAGAGNETTQDLGFDFDTTWRFLGFYRTSTGIQFCRWDASRLLTHGLLREKIGAEITTNIPTGPLYPISVGVSAGAIAVREIEIDMFAAGGGIAR